MLVSGGKLIAIDKVVSDNTTLSGDGVEFPLGVTNIDKFVTDATLSSVSSTLNTKIDNVSVKFDDYYTKLETSGKDELANEFAKYQELGDYLSANALDTVSSNWNSVYDDVLNTSSYWNSVSSISSISGYGFSAWSAVSSVKFDDYVTSSTKYITGNNAYVLVNSDNRVVWSGVDLTNIGKMYDITSVTPKLLSAYTATDAQGEPTYVVSAAELDIKQYEISGNGISAWQTDDTYLVSTNIVGDNNVTAKYDSDENAWHVGLSAENCAYLFGGYVNTEVVSENTVLKLESNNKFRIDIDQDGYITLPESTNKFTFCINEYIDDNSSNDHDYLLNKLVLSAKNNDPIIISQNYYPSEVGTSNITIATTIDNTAASDRKYCIVYKGSTIDTNKLHVNASIIEEVMSYDSIAGKLDDYTGINPIYVADDSRRIGLGWDENVFKLTEADELGRKKLTIEAGGQTVDSKKFEKMVNLIDTRIIETFPIGLVRDANAVSNQLSYLFRPTMSYDMTTATSAYMYHGNTSSDIQTTIGVYDVTTTPYTLVWQSEITTMPNTNGGQTVFKASSDAAKTRITTLQPDGLYYVTIRVTPGKTIQNTLGIYAQLGADVGTPTPVAILENYGNDMNLPMTANMSSIGVLGNSMHKAYIGFKGILDNA